MTTSAGTATTGVVHPQRGGPTDRGRLDGLLGATTAPAASRGSGAATGVDRRECGCGWTRSARRCHAMARPAASGSAACRSGGCPWPASAPSWGSPRSARPSQRRSPTSRSSRLVMWLGGALVEAPPIACMCSTGRSPNAARSTRPRARWSTCAARTAGPASAASSAAPRCGWYPEQVPTPSMVITSLIRRWPNLRTCSTPSDRPGAAPLWHPSSARCPAAPSPAGPAWSQVHGPVRARMPDAAAVEHRAQVVARFLEQRGTTGSSPRPRAVRARTCPARRSERR